MKKFLKTYLSYDGAGVFALIWVLGIFTAIYFLVSSGGTKF